MVHHQNWRLTLETQALSKHMKHVSSNQQSKLPTNSFIKATITAMSEYVIGARSTTVCGDNVCIFSMVRATAPHAHSTHSRLDSRVVVLPFISFNLAYSTSTSEMYM